jgi:hypothetical protein
MTPREHASRTILQLALLAGWTLAAPMVEGATSNDPLEPPDLGDYVRWGPIRARPSVGVSNLGKDDNVFFATGPEEPKSDYRVTVGGGLDGLVLFGDRAFLTFDERLSYTLYDKYGSATTTTDSNGNPIKRPSQDFHNQVLTSRVTFPFSGWGVFADLDFIQTEIRPSSEFDSRVKQQVERAGAGFIVELGWRSYAEFERSRSDWSYDEHDRPGTAAKLDRNEQSSALRVNYRLTGMTRLTLETELVEYSFDKDILRDSTQLQILPGFTFGEDSRLSGALGIGYSQFDMRDPRLDDFDSTIGAGSFRYRLGSGTTLRLDGGREVGFAVFELNTFYLNRFAEARATHYFNSIIGGTAAYYYGKLSYPQEDGARIDTNTEYELGVLFRALKTQGGKVVEYGLSWRTTQRDSVTCPVPPVGIPTAACPNGGALTPDANLTQSRSVWGFTANAGF